MEKKTEKTVINLEVLPQFGYEELNNCYIKRFSGYWVIRIDKKTKKLKYWCSKCGKTKNPMPYIQDLMKAGIVI